MIYLMVKRTRAFPSGNSTIILNRWHYCSPQPGLMTSSFVIVHDMAISKSVHARSWRVRLISGLTALFVLGAAGVSATLSQGVTMNRPDAPPLATRGSYTVGVKTLQLTDASRSRTFTVEVWYPSAEPDAPIFYDSTIGETPVKISGRATRDAAPIAEKFPLIIASHGQPGTRFQYTYLNEQLASRGFVVASIEHTGSTYTDLTQQDFVTSLVYRPQDILFTLDEIPNLIKSADGNNVGLLGYSYGGYSVINAAGAGLDGEAFTTYCQTSTDADKGPCFALPFFAGLEETRGASVITADPRIKAVFVMAPYGQPWLGEKSLANLKVPLFVAVGENDDVAVYARDGLEYYQRAGSDNKYLLTLEAAQHNPFVECPPEMQATWTDYERCSEPVWDHERAHDIIKHFASSFFETFLRGDEEAGDFLDSSLPGFKPRTTVGIKFESN
jgi:predicted dienelactone hydrolase